MERDAMHLEIKVSINESASRARLALHERQLTKRQLQLLKAQHVS
jgi:hypothetical protein